MPERLIPRLLSGGLSVCAAALLLAAPALAQQRYLEPGTAGLMMGSSIDPKSHRPIKPGQNWPAPVPGFTHGVVPFGNGGGGGNVIIINGVPCYAPWYYGGFYNPGYYNGPAYGGGLYTRSRLSYGLRIGGVEFQYEQGNGYSGYDAYPTYGNTRTYGQPVPVYVAPRNTGATASSQSRQTARREAEEEEDNTYYLHRKLTPLQKDPSLAQAVADIQTAFRTGNIAPLERHLVAGGTITLQTQGRSRKPLAVADYLTMTRDALASMKTVRYTLDKVEPASNGAWMVYGQHVLRSEQGAEMAFNVGFVLSKHDGDWIVTEVSADPAR